MSDNRLTVRFSDEEQAAIELKAKLSDKSRADVVRMAVRGLNGADKRQAETLEKLTTQAEELQRETAEMIKAMTLQNRRAALLILKVLNAPSAAEDALNKIYES